MIIRDLVTHIFLHVDAEATGESDLSQVAGVAARAQYVQTTLASFQVDVRDLDMDNVLAEFSSVASLSVLQVSFQQMIANMRDDYESHPQLVMQNWVGKAKERIGG